MVDSRLLREERFFADLTDNELDIIARITNEKDFELGETIFKESEDGHCLYVIRSGEVKACVTAPNGERFTLTIMKDGDIFGEMSFVDGRLRSATVIAISDVKTFVMDKSDFEALVDKNPRLIHKVMEKIVLSVHSIVRGMNSRYMEMINYMWGRKRFT
jgi:CRP/FNR family cyclic AMP-dependent transcriptional regulator